MYCKMCKGNKAIPGTELCGGCTDVSNSALGGGLATAQSYLRDIREEWAGSECGKPKTCQEAYAIELAKRMYTLACEGLKNTGG